MKVVTLDEFFGKENECNNSGDGESNELRFTGNWFIDAGILGFVNLMEEVYGWDLEELRKFALESTNVRLYSVFAYAFWYKVIKETTKRWLKKDIFKIKDLKNREINPQELVKNIENEILNEIRRRNEFIRKIVVEGGNPNDAILMFNE
ncbi:MAG: hypothetical protein H5T46_00855, partial [Archaeoglobi archaeon]|nr:hypothetical protein [Candidatus Mnemosynella sp.]